MSMSVFHFANANYYFVTSYLQEADGHKYKAIWADASSEDFI